MADDKKDFSQYGESEQGNFRIIDTVGVPHPYCITPKHLQFNDGMYMTKDSIRNAEKRGAVCDICKKLNNKDYSKPILTIDEHQQALLVECKADIQNNDELTKYLLSIKDLATKENYAGFSFLKKF